MFTCVIYVGIPLNSMNALFPLLYLYKAAVYLKDDDPNSHAPAI